MEEYLLPITYTSYKDLNLIMNVEESPYHCTGAYSDFSNEGDEGVNCILFC